MDSKRRHGIRRPARMILYHKTALHLEPFVRQGHASAEVRPAIPCPFLDFPEKVRIAPHWPASALVISVVRHIKLIAQECQTERVAQTPHHKLRPSAFRPDAHNCAAAWHLSFDHLPGL